MSSPLIVVDEFLPETKALLSSFSVRASYSWAKNADTLIRTLKDNGTWTKHGVLWLFAAESEGAAKTDWKNPGAHPFTTNTSIIFTANEGFTGDGVGCLDNTGFYYANVPGFAQNDAHAMAWSLIDVTPASTNSLFGHASSATGTTKCTPENSSSVISSRLNTDSADTSISNTDPTGMYTVRRNNSSNYQVWKNDSQVGSISVTSSTPTTSTSMRLLGDASNRSLLQIAMFSAGSALTDTEIEDDYTAFETFLTAVGAL